MSNWRYRFAAEEDDCFRPCTVYLHRRPIVDVLAYHWSLYFEFEDGYRVTYEADDDEGYLIPQWDTGKPRNPEGSMQIKIKTVLLSPKQVNEAARNNKYSGRHFVLTLVNCQVWATELARMLGLTIPIPCNMVQIISPPLGIALSAAHFLGLFGKKTSGSGWSRSSRS